MAEFRKLTAKQQLFIDEYLVDLNASKAAVRAGYSRRTARQIGEENLSKPDIARAVSRAMAERAERTRVSQDMVLHGLAKIAFYDIRKAFNANGTMKPIVEMDEETVAAIANMSVSERATDGGGVVRTQSVRLADRRAALVELGRHLGMFDAKLRIRDKAKNPIAELIRQVQGSALPVVAMPDGDEDGA